MIIHKRNPSPLTFIKCDFFFIVKFSQFCVNVLLHISILYLYAVNLFAIYTCNTNFRVDF